MRLRQGSTVMVLVHYMVPAHPTVPALSTVPVRPTVPALPTAARPTVPARPTVLALFCPRGPTPTNPLYFYKDPVDLSCFTKGPAGPLDETGGFPLGNK